MQRESLKLVPGLRMQPWNSNATPQAAAAFIEEVLNQLAELASVKGHRALATSLMLAALDAARAASDPPQTPDS